MDLTTLALAKKFTADAVSGAGITKGDTGDSAYQLAVNNGFSGTVTEWLASLKGEQGDKGNAFTYDDFTSTQLAALKGATGKSAYEIAQDNGFTGTEAEWIASLNGSIAVLSEPGETLWEGSMVAGGSVTLSASIYKYSMLAVTVADTVCLVVIPSTSTTTLSAFGGKVSGTAMTLAAATMSTEDGLTITDVASYFMEQRSNGTNGTCYATYITKIAGIANASFNNQTESLV